jgi:integrase
MVPYMAGARVSSPRSDYVQDETRDEANEWRIAELHAINRGLNVTPDKTTVAQWMKYWLDEIVIPPNTRPKTHESYRYMTAKHVEPDLGKVLLQKLTQPQVQTLLNRKAEKLAPKTVKQIRDTIRAALNVAKDQGLIDKNVAGKARPPKVEEREVRIFTKDEAMTFLETIKGHRLEGAFLIELLFGLRRGEVLGLRPEDLDWDNETFRVRRQLQWVRRRETRRVPRRPAESVVERPSVALDRSVGARPPRARGAAGKA